MPFFRLCPLFGSLLVPTPCFLLFCVLYFVALPAPLRSFLRRPRFPSSLPRSLFASLLFFVLLFAPFSSSHFFPRPPRFSTFFPGAFLRPCAFARLFRGILFWAPLFCCPLGLFGFGFSLSPPSFSTGPSVTGFSPVFLFSMQKGAHKKGGAFSPRPPFSATKLLRDRVLLVFCFSSEERLLKVRAKGFT